MKFLQLLARDMDKWPSGADWAVCVVSKHGEAKASFGQGEKPNPDMQDREFHTWTVCEPTVEARWLHLHRRLSEKASDQLTAIVTRAEWEAERAKPKAPKANGGGWVRHRGGKCPVEAGTLVIVRRRNGDINQLTDLDVDNVGETWLHVNGRYDIMAYHIHKPAEQPEIKLESGAEISYSPGEPLVSMDPADTMLAIRDRIRELDTQRAEVEATYKRQISEITQERESLVQKLAGEGLALVEVVVQPVKSLDDWRNWQAGDLLTFVGGHTSDADLTSGNQYKFLRVDEWDEIIVIDEAGDENGYGVNSGMFKFHSRPAS